MFFKKISAFIFITLFFLILSVGCVINQNMVEKVNSKVKMSKYFQSISFSYHRGFFDGTIFVKNETDVIKLTYYFKNEVNLSEMNWDFLMSSIQWVSYEIYNIDTRQYNMVRFFSDDRPAQSKNQVSPKTYDQAFDNRGWIDSPRGIAIDSKYVNLRQQKSVQFDGDNWLAFSSKYNLLKDITDWMDPYGQKGIVTVFLNQNNLGVMEYYESEDKTPLVIRRFWIGDSLSMPTIEVNYNELVGVLLNYYNKVQFTELLK